MKKAISPRSGAILPFRFCGAAVRPTALKITAAEEICLNVSTEIMVDR